MTIQDWIPRKGIPLRCGGGQADTPRKWTDKRRPGSGTEYSPNPNNAWNFNFNNGNQNNNDKNNNNHALAVLPG
jgi:hypothetical protein